MVEANPNVNWRKICLFLDNFDIIQRLAKVDLFSIILLSGHVLILKGSAGGTANGLQNRCHASSSLASPANLGR